MKDDSKSLFGELFETPRRKVVPVLVPMPAPTAYSYAVPDGLTVEPGAIVQVPLGPRQVIGVVWDGGEDGKVDPKKLREITKVFDCPPLDKSMRTFLDWVATYTLSPPGYVVRMALRAPAALDPEPMIEGLRYAGYQPERLTPARQKVLELASDGLSWTKSGLAHASGVSTSVIDGLLKQGVFEQVFLPPPPLVAAPDPDYAEHRLAGPQKEAAAEILDSLRKGGFAVSLIDGVTGSGKTEVYFEAIAETLKQGKQVLILLPEIALTANFLERFQDRFGSKPGEWHSDLATRTREKVWRQVAMGEIRVVAGARSALFL
ncbi:MAG: DEAD/DEAH box helicase, partial [Rhizobium rhizophilum]